MSGGLDLASALRPVRVGNAFEETVERLLTVVKLGLVPAGERLPPERELAAQLGISRLTRREAIKLTDALTFRFAVETGAAEVLARQLAGADEPAGSQAAEQEAAAGRPEMLLARLADVRQAGPADYRRLDTLFHLSIAELTGSSLLTAACTDARMRLNDLLNAIPVLKLNIAHTAAQHAAIVTAILAGDPERARRAVAEHLAGTGALLRGFLG